MDKDFNDISGTDVIEKINSLVESWEAKEIDK